MGRLAGEQEVRLRGLVQQESRELVAPLGDRDLATHLFRTGRLRAGEPLGAVTVALAARRGVAVRLLPLLLRRVLVRIVVLLVHGFLSTYAMRRPG